ncbi:MAG: DUF4349 domain-containing protein [Candidatus Promineifilaceae bacterium]
MKQWKKSLVWLFLAVFVVAACASQPQSMLVERDFAGEAGSTATDASEFAPSEPVAQSGNVAANMQLPSQPLIIRTGNLSIVVEDTDATVAAITSLVNSMEGWVVSSNLYKYGEARRGEMSVRVPVAQFDAAMEQIKALALEVNSESSSGQDVTEEYVDLTARLSNQEATAARVRGFLDEATDVEDALAVNQELSRLESEIEQIKGRMNYLSQSASFSTIQVDITPDVLSQPIEIAGWRPQGVAKEALEDLINGLQGLADFLIRFVIAVLPMLLIVGAPLFFIVRAIVRAVRKRRQPAVLPLENEVTS